MASTPVKLLSPFPKKLVRKAPAGKFGDYVPHANYVERLRDSGVKYSWTCEPVYGTHKGENRIVGAKGTITIEDMGSYDGFGDVDTFKLDNAKFNDGTNLKDAESDAFKRACMRFGLGVELWSGSEVTEEEHTATLVSTTDPDTDDIVVTKVDMRRKENKTPEPVARPMEEIGKDEAPFSDTSQSTDDKETFINHTIEQMTEGYEQKVIDNAIDLADKYAKLRKYPEKSRWSDKQIDAYLSKIEIGLSSEVASVDDDDDVITKANVILGGVLEKTAENQSVRDDLKCPFCQKKVYDNRHDKKSDRSPDFVCSGRDPQECPAHTGKWRKSWWLNSNDLPKEWGFDN